MLNGMSAFMSRHSYCSHRGRTIGTVRKPQHLVPGIVMIRQFPRYTEDGMIRGEKVMQGNRVNLRELVLETLLAITRDQEYSHIAIRNTLENCSISSMEYVSVHNSKIHSGIEYLTDR